MSTTPYAVQAALPQNLDAEKSVLGALILDNSHFSTVVEILTPDDFLLDAHQRIFRAIIGMLDRNQPVDLVTLAEELRKERSLDRVGSATYLAGLLDGIPKVINAVHYARLVKEKSVMRSLMQVGQRMRDGAAQGDRTAEELVEESVSTLFQISEGRAASGFLSLGDIMHSTYGDVESLYAHEKSVSGIRTGYEKLDEITLGLHRANLIVIAARPSVGKTAFCLNVAEHSAINDRKTVAIFSLEMSRGELALRLLCANAQVDLRRLRREAIEETDMARLSMAFAALADAPIFIDDSPTITVTEMRARSRRLKMERGLDLLIIDYLQLVSVRGRYDNRNQEVSAITRSLKALAKELDIPLVCVSQLSRAPESRKDHRPQLSDLRESGAIEQDADLVCFLYKPEEKERADEGVIELMVSKNRNGPAGQPVDLVFIPQFTKFVSYGLDYRF
ncbi:MAG: replicative DNA helicase [Acidobacteriota bacterium]